MSSGVGWVACDLCDGCLILDFGTLRLAPVIAQAVQPAPEDRFPTVAAFASAWQSARADA